MFLLLYQHHQQQQKSNPDVFILGTVFYLLSKVKTSGQKNYARNIKSYKKWSGDGMSLFRTSRSKVKMCWRG